MDRERLVRSAPREAFRVPDYFGLGEGLLMQSLFHMMEALSLSTMYFHASSLLADPEFLARATPERRQGLRGTVRGLAYVFAAKRDGWERFCSGWRIDPQQLLEVLPGYRALGFCEEEIRAAAFSPEEAAAWHAAGDQGNGSGRVVTAEDVAASMAEFVRQRARLLGHQGGMTHEPERDGRLHTATQTGIDAAAAERC